jgi:hypothetical protein
MIITLFHRGGMFDSIRPLITTRIQQEESNVSIITECKQPALLGEWFPVKISLSTSEKIFNVNIFVNLLQDNNSEQLSKLIFISDNASFYETI